MLDWQGTVASLKGQAGHVGRLEERRDPRTRRAKRDLDAKSGGAPETETAPFPVIMARFVRPTGGACLAFSEVSQDKDVMED